MPTARENCSPRAVGNAQKQGALIMTNRVQESKSKATLTVAELAEEEEHHPDIDIRFNKVRLVLATHSKGGLTDLDFALAERIDTLSE